MSWFKRIIGLEGDGIALTLVNDDNFKDEISNSKIPVVLDLWSPGCQPCKQLAPIMVDLQRKYKDKIKVAQCDISAAPGIAQRLRVRGTPTVLYFKNGKVVERVVGFRGSLYHTEIIETDLLGKEFSI
ncbi:thioredoxin family protein [Myxococcota bacterium]|nr:thioredoxin family protein [Myxococcota bacterium]